MDPVIIFLIALIIGGTLLILIIQGRTTAAVEHRWLVAADDGLYKPDNEQLVKESLNQFVQRVAQVIERKTGCQTVPDRDLIRVYKGNKLVGIVRCCEVGRNANPAIVREVVELAQHLNVRTMYLAASGPVPADTQTFARLQQVRIIVV